MIIGKTINSKQLCKSYTIFASIPREVESYVRDARITQTFLEFGRPDVADPVLSFAILAEEVFDILGDCRKRSFFFECFDQGLSGTWDQCTWELEFIDFLEGSLV